MGLVGISTPQLCETEDILKSELHNVIVVTNTDSVLKIYYSTADSVKLLERFLQNNNLEQSIINAVMTKFGKKPADTDHPSALSHKLPGVDIIAVNPVNGVKSTLHSTIINLNDEHKWSREDIAQWIENTFDIKDISFNVEEVPDENTKLSEFTRLVKIERIL